MNVYKLKIGDKTFNIVVVSSKEAMARGLSGTKKLKEGAGMLFDFKKEGEVTMNMFKMNYPLDFVFIDSDLNVIRVDSLEPGENTISNGNTKYVLEINKGEGKGLEGKKLEIDNNLAEELGIEATVDKDKKITNQNIIITKGNSITGIDAKKFKAGGSIKLIEEEVKAEPGKMQVLDDKGKVLMNIKGGERIFSIKHTEQIMDLIDKIKNGEAKEEELGKLMAEIIHTQDTQEPEYTDY